MVHFTSAFYNRGYFLLLELMEGLIQSWGISMALYSDRHAVFKHNTGKVQKPG